MATDPRTKYLDAHAAFLASRKAFSELVDPAHNTASTLARTWNVIFGALPKNQSFQQSQMRPTVDLSQWPTAEQIQAGAQDCKQKHDAMKAAWDLVPETSRSGLETPPQR